MITDGAFPTHGTMVPYIKRWCEVYVPNPTRPMFVSAVDLRLLARTGRWHTERRLKCRFPSVEAAAAKLAPRPWLMIHGEADSYISPEIAQGLFRPGQGIQGALAGQGRQAQSLPRDRPRRIRRADR